VSTKLDDGKGASRSSFGEFDEWPAPTGHTGVRWCRVPCDLHLHSDCSDGSLPVRELVRAAQAAGVSLLAVTDHDTVAGLAAALDEARKLGLVLIAGVEISTQLDALELHILGYGFDPTHPALGSLLVAQVEARRARLPAILEKLGRLGLPITVEEVEACARGGPPGRPHIAEVLVARGYVKDEEEAFRLYLADGAVAWVPKPVPAPREAIAAIHAAGGKAVWAHPLARAIQRPGGFDRLVHELAGAKLDGLEVVHPGHTPEARKRIRRAARELGLLVTGGSDFHGRLTPGVRIGRGRGDDEVPTSWGEALLE
jgi:3',5'-nucleoside bisphosphate phosphatase